MVKLRMIFEKRYQPDGAESIVKCRNAIDDEEEKHKERAVLKKRKHLDGVRAIEIDDERGILKCRSEIDEEEEHKDRAIVKKGKQIGEEKAIVICKNEIDDGKKEEENMKERLTVKFDETDRERLVGGKINYSLLPSPCKDLPVDLIEGILTRLEARELIHCSCTNTKNAYYFRVKEVDNVMCDVACMAILSVKGTMETVGHSNGLTCVRRADSPYKRGVLMVINPITAEQFGFYYATPTRCLYLCSGFGFDPLSQEYKAVVIFTSETRAEFVCMVFTLGTDSWRKTTTSTAEISAAPGSPPYRSRMATKVLTRKPTLCGGDLFWRVTNKVRNNSRTEMLLLFDLHSEKIQFIRFPTVCTRIPPPATTTTMNEHHQYLAVDHFLEFKGYPCIARSERIMVSNSDHIGHRCVAQSSFCCCCCKVHMYILKDKVKQVWIKEETFDVQIKCPEDLLPGAFCCFFGTSTTVTTPPTRVLGFSDQVILSWFTGDDLLLYNLRTKDLDVVMVARYGSRLIPSGRHDIYPRDMDYQLRSQVDNMVSLRTFIPEGAETRKFNCYDDFNSALHKNIGMGYVIRGRNRNSVNICIFGLVCSALLSNVFRVLDALLEFMDMASGAEEELRRNGKRVKITLHLFINSTGITMRLSIYSACHLLQWLLPRQERKGNKKELLMPRMRVQTAAEATRQMLTKKVHGSSIMLRIFKAGIILIYILLWLQEKQQRVAFVAQNSNC
ncbi:hypothetical protein C5167_042199 [Papaver somniferum]|uniref:F-box associated beta-propeller type 3 domain-containing protein n=1 Tax=Papaver somniferum TaxID=3469 RepID=A0A4Y7L249_PAPSO|nr:hypothetical protein C5167_042199 [Papaver somniferum]